MYACVTTSGVCNADKTSCVCAFRNKALISSAHEQRIGLPSITDLNWRVDVTVSTTTMSRVFKPTVLMRLTLSDGSIRTFECPVDKFHELRYNVAKVLKSVQDLSQHPIIFRENL